MTSWRRKTLLAEFRSCYPYSDLDEETIGRVSHTWASSVSSRVDGEKLSRTRGTREYYYPEPLDDP